MDKGNKNCSPGLAFFSVLLVAVVLFFILHRTIYGLQVFLYEGTGETLIGSNSMIIGIFALVLSMDFFIVDSFYKFIRRIHPEFYRKYYHDPRGSFVINKVAFRRFKFVLAVVMVLGICGVWFFFNEYIVLGDRYIAASKAAFANNRTEYSYSEVQIIKAPSKKVDGSWVYKYIFSDGKELANIGAFARDTIQRIENAQKRADVNKAFVYEKPMVSGTSKSISIQFFSYLIWGAVFFFIPWCLNLLFRKKE